MASNTTVLESTESSSPIVTRAVSAGLRREFCDTYSFKPWQRAALRALGWLPQTLSRTLISRSQAFSALSPAHLDEICADQLASQRLQDYDGLAGPFSTITIGAALGGASAHLALATGGPFLPQAFVLTIRGGSQDGDAGTYFRCSTELAASIAQRNPDSLIIQHYDPVHDGWVTHFANHLRIKLLDLPNSYIEFIRRSLQPGGSICYLDCKAEWLRYRVGERQVFQVGGWGGIPAAEFIEGSDRLRRYCQKAGLHHCGWQMQGFPLETGPESEWGCEPALGEALEAFCRREGYRFVRISLAEPKDFSRLAYQAAGHALQEESRTPAGVLVEIFTQFDATAAWESGLLPLWLVFNTQDSLDFLKEMRGCFPGDKPIFFSPLATFSLTPDLVPMQDWESALRGLNWVNIGARASHYPSDPLALVGWAAPLRRWVQENGQPLRTRLSAETLKALAVQR